MKRRDRQPIGMFDSGFGGLTVARAVIDLLPGEHLVYVGDTGRYPYGSKPQSDVADYARQIANYLITEHDAKVIVVACNTAASAVDLAAELTVPVVGVIEPGARSLVKATRSGRVGVIGTVGTIGSGSYQRAVTETDPCVSLTCAACPGFVEFVERGVTEGDEITVLAERLLAADFRGRDRHASARLHPLPIPRSSDRRCARNRGRARVLGRRNRVRTATNVARLEPAAHPRIAWPPPVPVERRRRLVSGAWSPFARPRAGRRRAGHVRVTTTLKVRVR